MILCCFWPLLMSKSYWINSKLYVCDDPDDIPSLRLYDGELNVIMRKLNDMNINPAEYASVLAAIGQQCVRYRCVVNLRRHAWPLLGLLLEVISTGIWSIATRENLWPRQWLEFPSQCLAKAKPVLTGRQSFRGRSVAETSSLFVDNHWRKHGRWSVHCCSVATSCQAWQTTIISVTFVIAATPATDSAIALVNVTWQGCCWSQQCIVSGRKYKKESCVLCRWCQYILLCQRYSCFCAESVCWCSHMFWSET